MSNCPKCGGSLTDPFALNGISSETCQCNTAGMVQEGGALPSDACCVSSVNGKTGDVVLTINDIDLLGNQFFTNQLVWDSLGATAPLYFDVNTGIISHLPSGVTAGVYGSASLVPVITVDDKGHITSISTASIASAQLGDDLTAIQALTGTGYLVRTGSGAWTLRTIQGVSGRIDMTYGDAVTGPTVIDLAVSGVTAGTYGGTLSYPVITVDAYGRITSASTQAISFPSIPAHTHSLGALSNVDPNVDSSATDGDSLVYDSGTSKWTYSTTSKYEQNTLTLDAGWNFCTGAGDVDATDMDQPINMIQRHTDTKDKREVHLNAAVYRVWSDISGILSTTGSLLYGEIRIGSVPAGYEPIHSVTFPCAAMVRGQDYLNSDHSVGFDGNYQILDSLSIVIQPNGAIYLLIAHLRDYMLLNLSTVDQILVPITGSYPTKQIVP